MALIENKFWGVEDKVQIAIERLREFEPPEGYYLAFSGGKDSQTIYHLAQMAGVKFDAHYNLTTVDPPELVQFIRKHYPEVAWNIPEETMWSLIVRKRLPPTRVVRYCCQVLKEGGGPGRVIITGVRWEESARRRRRGMVEACMRDKSRQYVNPIIDWSSDDVWAFIKQVAKVPYCELYDQGFKRLGCIMCPMQGAKGMQRDAERWPKYCDAYMRAFQRMYDKREADGMENEHWLGAQDVMDWWMSDKKGDDPDQTVLFE